MKRGVWPAVAWPALAMAAGCTTGGAPLVAEVPSAATREVASDPIWAYVREKYDTDSDGRVAAAEYDRGTERFARLDGNGDGTLDATDFAARGDPAAGERRGRGRERPGLPSAPDGDERGRRLLWRLFGPADSERLSLQELLAAFRRADTGGDGTLDQDELTAWMEGRDTQDELLARLGEGEVAVGDVAAALGGPPDGTVSRDAVEAFFTRLDRDGNGVWEMESDAGRSMDGGGVAEGEPAPDFTLPQADGGPAVTLSAFAGDRPVALIFGSYT